MKHIKTGRILTIYNSFKFHNCVSPCGCVVYKCHLTEHSVNPKYDNGTFIVNRMRLLSMDK